MHLVRLVFCFSFVLLISNGWAQDEEIPEHKTTRCYTTQKVAERTAHDPGLHDRLEAAKNRILEHRDIQESSSQKAGIFVVIPVVVHVVYSDASQNISKAQIHSQLDVLNADYSRTNDDAFMTPSVFKPLAGNPEIVFRLATLDPNGNNTDGITRTFTSNLNIGNTNRYYQSALGGKDIWDRDQYMNIWICEIGNDILGFASPPGSDAESDGLVLDPRFFGTMGTALSPYNEGRSTTHEVGHWLGLDHIWGVSGSCTIDDGIDDTPPQDDFQSGCPVFPTTSCSNDPNGDMFMNYMDYTNDACMNLFTKGQVEKMHTTVNILRPTLFSSMALTGINEPWTTDSPELGIFPNPSNGAVKIAVNANGSSDGTVSVYSLLGELIWQQKLPATPTTTWSVDFSDQPRGIYMVSLQSSAGVTTKKLSLTN